MKYINLLFSFMFCLGLVSCSKQNSHIPETSIIDEIPINKLSDILDYENSHEINYVGFENFYPQVRRSVEKMSDIEKAKFSKLTYRELVNGVIAINDTTEISKFEKDWEEMKENYLPQAKQIASQLEHDITIDYQSYLFSTGKRDDFWDYLSQSGYDKFLNKYTTLSPAFISENSWKYENIIKYKIDNNFLSKDIWVRRQMLKTIENQYPLAFEFLSDKENERERTLDSIINE